MEKNVAKPASCSESIILALCGTFAGYCVYFTNIRSGGFHFYGQSSGGKSTTLLVAASVRGNEESMSSWKLAEAGFEEDAESYNHGLLVLDELAGPEFVRKLLRKGEDDIKSKLAHLIDKFLIHHDMDNCNNGIQRRIALRFALAYASGILAVNLKIFPYTRKDIMKAVSACYCRARKPAVVKKERVFNESFIVELLSPNVLNIKVRGMVGMN